MEYPKIETLFDRDPATFKVIPGRTRLPEFELPKWWLVTEKIDGTNIRVRLHLDGTVTYGGRTDKAQMYAPLVVWLRGVLPPAVVAPAFDPATEAILFGEGYGPGIQKGGVYRKNVAFRLFDVAVLTPARIWWLNWADVQDVAKKCNVETVPSWPYECTLDEAIGRVNCLSTVATQDRGTGSTQEGIVCRTEPLLFTRTGQRVMWKLKGRDF